MYVQIEVLTTACFAVTLLYLLEAQVHVSVFFFTVRASEEREAAPSVGPTGLCRDRPHVSEPREDRNIQQPGSAALHTHTHTHTVGTEGVLHKYRIFDLFLTWLSLLDLIS